MAGIPSVSPALGKAVGIALALMLLIVAVMVLRPSADTKTLTASFPRTVSLYEGSEVRVIGVGIGEVETIEPSGTSVKVTMSYDAKVKVPADAKAVMVAPSVVGDRFIQLTPAYSGGDVLEDGATLGEDRTATPIELDEIYQSLNDLAVGLGPDGANKEGALTRLLESTARNFDGQGEQFGTTIENLSRFTTTLDNNKEELFEAAEEIERFVSTLADNDQTVRDFNDSLAAASGMLEEERDDLAAALRNLGVATEQVSTFVKENKDALSANIKGLVRLTDILVRQRAALDETLTAAPTALANLYHTYNPRSGTLDTRANLAESLSLVVDPAAFLCSATKGADDSGQLCDAFVDALGRPAPGSPSSRKPLVIERNDPTLAGLLEVSP